MIESIASAAKSSRYSEVLQRVGGASQYHPSSINLTAWSADEADRLLNDTVEELQRLARMEGAAGILVTKTGPGQFTAELSEAVPYGITWEVRI
ncbi:MAG: hypothetical protein ACQEXN_15345 [Actinomycetota bacterium]